MSKRTAVTIVFVVIVAASVCMAVGLGTVNPSSGEVPNVLVGPEEKGKIATIATVMAPTATPTETPPPRDQDECFPWEHCPVEGPVPPTLSMWQQGPHERAYRTLFGRWAYRIARLLDWGIVLKPVGYGGDCLDRGCERVFLTFYRPSSPASARDSGFLVHTFEGGISYGPRFVLTKALLPEKDSYTGPKKVIAELIGYEFPPEKEVLIDGVIETVLDMKDDVLYALPVNWLPLSNSEFAKLAEAGVEVIE